MNNDLKRLQDRVEQLEAVERDYIGLNQLIDHAANNGNLDEYGGNAFLCVHQSTGKIEDASPQALALLGFTQDELRQHRIDEIEITSDDLPQNHVTYVQNTSQEHMYTCAYRHHDGYRLPIRVYQRVIHVDSDGTVLQYTLEDLSLRKKLWRELSRREDANFHFREKLKQLNEINLQMAEAKSLYELCKIGVQLGMEKLGFDRLSIWLQDEETQVVTGTYGVDEKGAIRDERGSKWSYVDTYVMEFVEGKNTLFVIQNNAPIYNHASQVVGYGWHISVPLLYRGRFIGFMAADNFINQRDLKDYQPELLRLYGITIGHLAAYQRELDTIRKLSDAIQHSDSMIGILNEEAIIEFVNGAFVHVSGYKAEDVIGKSLAFLLPESGYQPIWEAISNKISWQGELTQRKQDGQPYETIVALLPIKTGDGVHNFVLVQEDITEQKRTRKYEFDLRLEQARTRMLETFIRDIGHEFRTPLSIIKVKAYLVQKATDDTRKGQLAAQIEEQADVISAMMDDLIYLVKLESESDAHRVSLDLKQITEDTVQDVATASRQKPLQWNRQLAVVPHIMGDAEKLARAIREVVKNAVQYTPANGTITVALSCAANQVHLRIQDTGMGIPKHEIEKIFTPLYRVDQARTERGTGLGLSITKRILEMHYGTITVESTPNVGSTFVIQLPLPG
ncbi:MAG: PAS domain S-box protein [Anaerolineae bacterium]|nr:PAS domain S-box protein [Anaerolineae bacterium]